ncbi:hypothetical protein DL766_005671 [Monosporascus sp. MC13-8B]|uniref:Uncharacterized protein n=1 Tax=Monosporascus cannonballus TaxID=155416 RepID=A0ABY0H526_9PEZI|nr:hypothetical protein DL762_005371 [Monosporascus cannonballus]RYO86843.1 hypothetical protein DL763_006551 [Monosporascus cannonballus]RYP28840.1 hypothetical protein DL766_005671 [Monosporascus sp. MC13-8B]
MVRRRVRRTVILHLGAVHETRAIRPRLLAVRILPRALATSIFHLFSPIPKILEQLTLQIREPHNIIQLRDLYLTTVIHTAMHIHQSEAIQDLILPTMPVARLGVPL